MERPCHTSLRSLRYIRKGSSTTIIHLHIRPNLQTKDIFHDFIAYQKLHNEIHSGLRESKHAYGRSSTPIAQGLVYDINAPHAFGLRESKPKAMHAYGRSSAPITQGLVYDINAPHAFGMRESKPNAMHAYGSSSAPIAQGLVYDINAPHTYRYRCRVVEAHTVSLRAPTGKPTGAIGKRASGA